MFALPNYCALDRDTGTIYARDWLLFVRLSNNGISIAPPWLLIVQINNATWCSRGMLTGHLQLLRLWQTNGLLNLCEKDFSYRLYILLERFFGDEASFLSSTKRLKNKQPWCWKREKLYTFFCVSLYCISPSLLFTEAVRTTSSNDERVLLAAHVTRGLITAGLFFN